MKNEAVRDVWSVRMQELARSGLGIRPWCVQEGIKEPSFHYWRKQLSTSASPLTQLIALPFVQRQAEVVENLNLRLRNYFTLRRQLGGSVARTWPCSSFF